MIFPLKRPLGAAALSLFLFALAAQAEEPSASFSETLVERGWQVEQRDNGDIILRPASPTVPKMEESKRSITGNEPEKPSRMSRLTQALREAGWKVEQMDDGSLLLFPRQEPTAKPPLDEAALQRLGEAGWTISQAADGSLLLFPPRSQPAPGSSPTHQPGAGQEDTENRPLESLKAKLEAAGWRTRYTQDGSLLLFPAAPEPASQADTGEAPLDEALQKRLKEAGWTVRKEKDGSLLLFPPRLRAALLQPCPGVRTLTNVPLPLADADAARAVATAWLEASGLPNAAVGRIRKVLRIHLVSIVAREQPHRLLHQLAIRNRDGHVILLD